MGNADQHLTYVFGSKTIIKLEYGVLYSPK